MTEDERKRKQKYDLGKLLGTNHGKKVKWAVFKCKDCEMEISIPPNKIDWCKDNLRCNNPRCRGMAERGRGTKMRRK